jgi:hypothetical protein
MAKRNPYDKKMREIFGAREIDDNASSVREIAESRGFAMSHISKVVREKLKNGEIERVWKHSHGRLCAAYRPRRGK